MSHGLYLKVTAFVVLRVPLEAPEQLPMANVPQLLHAAMNIVLEGKLGSTKQSAVVSTLQRGQVLATFPSYLAFS